MMERRPVFPKRLYGALQHHKIYSYHATQPVSHGYLIAPFLKSKPCGSFFRVLLLALIPFLVPSSLLASVNPLTGLFEAKAVDLFVQFQSVQLKVSRVWTSQYAGNDLPVRWTFRPFGKHIVQGSAAGELIIEDGGQRIFFEQSQSKGTFSSVSQGYVLLGEEKYQWVKQDGTVETFARDGRLSTIQYADGKVLQISSKGISVESLEGEERSLLTVTYNPQGFITTIHGYNGISSSYLYDSKGVLTSVTNQDNLTTTYEYDERWRLARIVYQTGDFVNVSYEETSGLVKAVGKKDGVTTYSYVRGETGLISKTIIEGPTGRKQKEVLQDDSGRIIMRSTDSAGNVTEETYTPLGLLASFKDAKGQTVSYAYDELNRLQEISYPNNSSLKYSYLGNTSLIAKTVLPNGAVIHQTYNDRLQLLNVSGPGKSETSYSYNKWGLPQSIIQGKDNKRITTLEYDERGFLTAQRDALGRIVSYQRDEQGRLVALIDPLGRNRDFQYNQYGQIEKILQSSQPILSRTYDDQLRIAKSQDNKGLTTQYEYFPEGNLKAITDTKGVREQFDYDQNGELAAIVDSTGKRIPLDLGDYDGTRSAKGHEGSAPARQYDPFGNLIQETASDGSMTQWQYDSMNRLDSILMPSRKKQKYRYDAGGNLISEKNVQGDEKRYVYDEAGNLIKVILPNGEETTYDLDPQGTGAVVAAHTSDGRTYQYRYDLGGRLVQATHPWGERISYTYDKADRLIKKTSSMGGTISYDYDDFDRITKVVTSDGVEQGFTYDSRGNLITIKGPQFEKHLAYNEFNELIAEKYPLLGKTIHYAYDKAGNRTLLEVPGHLKVTYAYNTRGNLTEISYGPNHTIMFSYDVQNRKKEVKYPNGVSIGYYYNAANLVTRITFFDQQGKEIQRQEYEYDGLKRVINIIDSQGASKQFQYDSNGQLIQSNIGRQAQKTFHYAPSLKRVVDIQGEAVKQFQYNEAGQLIKRSAHSMEYDGSGNLAKVTGHNEESHFRFNAAGMLTTIQAPTETVQYTYSPEGQRIGKQVGPTTTSYLYDGKNLLMVLDKDHHPVQTFIQGNLIDSPLVMLQKKEAYYFLPDHQGSTIGLVNDQGVVTTRYEYDPFGSITRKGKELGNPLTYTGRFFDKESGLYYYRARYYAPNLGVFLSPDPYPKAFEFPGTLNDYAYVQNDPINLVDPLGLFDTQAGRVLIERFVPAFTEPTMLGGPGANPAAFFERMANDYQWLHKNVGPQTAERFRQMMNRGLHDMLPKRSPLRPGILQRAWEGAANAANRLLNGARGAASGVGNAAQRARIFLRGGNTLQVAPSAGTGTPTGMARPTMQGPRPTVMNQAPGSGSLPPSGPGATMLTEGRSSFQSPSIANRLNQPVSGGRIVGGILGSVLIGYDVGSQYADQARREGRSVTAGEYAQSAGYSAARAVAAVLTVGGSEAAIMVNRAREEWNARNAAQAEQGQAEAAARQGQRQTADKILAFAQQATALVGQARAFKPSQATAIQQTRTQYESAQGKLALLEGLQTPADFNVECRTCQSKIDQLVKLKADAEGYKDTLTGNRDLARERQVLVCQDPYQPDAPSHAQMASSAASFAQGNAQAIHRFASQASALESQITQCLTSIETNTTALMDLQATSGRVDTIVTEISSLADKARAFGAEARSFQGKCQQLQGRMARIDNVAKATPDQIVIQVGGEDGPHEIIPTTGAKATITKAVGDLKSTCDQVTADATNGDTYGNYADIIAQSAREKAARYKAKLEVQTVHACTAGPLPPGIAADLQALAGAAEVLASYAATDAGKAQQCLATAQSTPSPDQPSANGSQLGDDDDLLTGFPDAPEDASPSGDGPLTPEQAQAVEGFGGSGSTSHLPPSDPDQMVSGDSGDTPAVDIAAVAQAERDKDDARNRDREGIQRDEGRQADEDRQTINQQNAQDQQAQDAAARQGVAQAQAQGQVQMDQANQDAATIMSGQDMAGAIDQIQQEGEDKIEAIDDQIRQGLGGGGQGGGSTRQPLPPPPSMGTGPVDTAVVQCNTKYGAGGDNPGFFTIDFGGATGVAQFEYDTESIKDEMIVSAGGPPFNTTCRSHGETVPITIPSPNTPVTVTVKPNCACKKAKCTGTSWSFTFYCPTGSGSGAGAPPGTRAPLRRTTPGNNIPGGIFGQ